MVRKRTTIQDYRGYLTGHLVAFFGDGPIGRIEPTHITACLKPARTNGRRANGRGTRGLSGHVLDASKVRKRFAERSRQ
jgi:hypothetical protein